MHSRLEKLLGSAVRATLQQRRFLLRIAHLPLFALAFILSFELRFDFSLPPEELRVLIASIGWVILLKMAAFQLWGSFHGWWRYVTFSDLAVLLRATTISTLAIVVVDYFMIHAYQIPRVVVLLDWISTMLIVGGTRSSCRLVREQFWPMMISRGGRRAFLIGFNPSLAGLVHHLHQHPRLDYQIVGFFTDNSFDHGSSFGGIPILGNIRVAVGMASQYEVTDLLVASEEINGRQLRKLLEEARHAKLGVHMIPKLDDMIHGAARVPVREVDINDLLRRDPVQLDAALIGGMIRDRTIAVTGAGGSIGSEICRQLLQHDPRRLVLIERAENSLFHLERELSAIAGEVHLIPAVADVRDKNRLAQIFAQYRPELVFHAAAHKHVPMMEFNVGEAIANNVLGTRNVVEIADEFGAERCVLISTDKAVNPTSVMGLTKQFAERFAQAYSENSETKFVVVRFGNVLGSNGSVVPMFREQIQRGGPVTVTHKDMRRFFMTIPEASQLVLQSAAMGKGGEIFVLDMGQQIRIYDLALDLIRLSGFTEDDIEIQFTGIRPGEKLFEELSVDSEQLLDTQHAKVQMAYQRSASLDEIKAMVDLLESLIYAPEDQIRAKLCELAPDYRPSSVGDEGSSPTLISQASVSETAVQSN